jgi:hypothetical protein
MKKFEYNYQDIFQDIDGDPYNVLLTIPEEVCKITGMAPGDIIRFEVENDVINLWKIESEIPNPNPTSP